MKAFALICCFILLSSCVNYQIPVESDDLPISTNTKISQIELSPILEIKIEDDDARY